MPGINEYIEQFGSESFCDRPFGDADNMVISQVAYLDFEKVVSPSFDDAPKDFAEASNELFAVHNYVHKPVGLVIPDDASVNSMRMAVQKRFSEMKVWAAQTAYARFPALQFAAMTFLLPSGETVVAYRGTDDTLAGWIEDIDVYLRQEIPSWQYAVDYLEEAAAHTKGDLIVCGHSKGGHLALYAAVKVCEETRARIRVVYNNDGQGYNSYELMQSEAYRQLLPRYRHFVPHSSFVGMLLAHDYDYTAVFSTKPIGPLQHDMGSWQIVNGAVITRPDVDDMAKITDIIFSEFTGGISEEHREILAETAAKLSCGAKEELLLDIVHRFPSELRLTLKNWHAFPKQMRKEFHAVFRPFPGIVANTVKNIKEETVPNAAKAAGVLLRKAKAVVVN